MEERRNYRSVVGLSDARRLPRIGRLRLGLKAEKNGRTYPTETDYFVIDTPNAQASPVERDIHKKFCAIYGEKPKTLDIILPVEDREQFFPQANKLYGAAGLKCVGDGRTAQRLGSDKAFHDVKEGCAGPERCPFSQKNGKGGKPGCKFTGTLYVMLPLVSLAGYFQIVTGSKTATISINSALDSIRQMFGRVSGLAYMNDEQKAETVLRLVRRPARIQYEGSSRIHYLCSIEPRISLDQYMKLRSAGALGAPASAPALPAAASTITGPLDQDEAGAPATVDLETGEIMGGPGGPVDDSPAGPSIETELETPEQPEPEAGDEVADLLDSERPKAEVIDIAAAIAKLGISERAKKLLLTKDPAIVRAELKKRGIAV